MKDEFEIVKHPQIKYLNLFLVNIDYRSSHLHQDIELSLILNGDVTISSKYENYHFNSDSCVIFNANQPHEIQASKEGASILCLQISHKFCTSYFPNLPNLCFDSFNIKQSASEEDYSYIRALTIEMAYQYYTQKVGYEFSCMSILNLLFRIFLNILPYRVITERERILNEYKVERLNRILNYIDENYTHKLSLSDVAEKENLSMSYLSHFIKENLDQSFQEYVNNLRFSHAKKLLLTNDIPLIDICLESGFSDYRYLYKAFRENYACTPTEYRELYSRNSSEIRYKSPSSAESFYSKEDTLKILEKLHVQYHPILYRMKMF
ncbi:hypothetical protein LF65_01608 [Clostridium beijerinckii]|uniref:HTH araC/xylS-type domain-containing protein n=1 Tax=Clostridium beijerinckii TaxID=1520 RepID=A0A0B5QN33_CLOBE|nr:AraC family transcriptional regulator [Clostridium beijerinckii]AJG98213.1 hypothetical protein LF65_01608 [Clostridium beijerinckii]